MYAIREIKSLEELHQVFGWVADGETVLVSEAGVVVLSLERYKQLENIDYDNKIERTIRQVQVDEGVVFRTGEERPADDMKKVSARRKAHELS